MIAPSKKCVFLNQNDGLFTFKNIYHSSFTLRKCKPPQAKGYDTGNYLVYQKDEDG